MTRSMWWGVELERIGRNRRWLCNARVHSGTLACSRLPGWLLLQAETWQTQKRRNNPCFKNHLLTYYINKTRTSKVGAISKAQKAQSIFLKKTWNFWKLFFRISAEKCERGDPLGFINIHQVAKYQKTRRGLFWDIEKNSAKSHTVPKKIERVDPLVSSGFVGYLKKVKNERGTLCSKFALAGLGLSGFRSFSKKWTDQWRKKSL